MTTFIEVISTSAPHIYHSALPLAPRTSVVRKLHKSNAYPFARIVQGSNNSWGPITATARSGSLVWSPCGRFIAVPRSFDGTVDIMDGTTLAKLNTFSIGEFSRDEMHALSLSPDSRLLTAVHGDRNLTSWDLQTGGRIGTSTLSASWDSSQGVVFLCTHSMDGEILAVGHKRGSSWTISAFNLLSGTQTCSHHSSGSGEYIVEPIWTHEEHLRFAVLRERSIVIQETGFTSPAVLHEVESLPAPPYAIQLTHRPVFLPSLSRIALSYYTKLLVWDARRSKILLRHRQGYGSSEMAFSIDGQFFAAPASTAGDIYLWKDTSAGYLLHQRFPLRSSSIFSPDGESIILHGEGTFQLWPTRGQLFHPISILPAKYILGFSPDGTLAAVAHQRQHQFTILDLDSGDLRLILDVDEWIVGLGLTRNSIVVVLEKKVVTWDMPSGARSFSKKWKIPRSPRTTVPLSLPDDPYIASISHSLGRIAVSGKTELCVFDGFTGHRACTKSSSLGFLWFTPDGCEIWSGSSGNHPRNPSSEEGSSLMGWKIVENSRSGSAKLEPLEPTAHPSGVLPWQSPHGHKVTPDGWLRSSSGKLLLWLPGGWRSNDEEDVIWPGRFVGLIHKELSEPVILELGE